MDPFNVGRSREFNTVDFTTRYFTSRRDDPHGIEMPFDPMVDPNRILGSMKNDTHFHSEDNKVLYYALDYGANSQTLR